MLLCVKLEYTLDSLPVIALIFLETLFSEKRFQNVDISGLVLRFIMEMSEVLFFSLQS